MKLVITFLYILTITCAKFNLEVIQVIAPKKPTKIKGISAKPVLVAKINFDVITRSQITRFNRELNAAVRKEKELTDPFTNVLINYRMQDLSENMKKFEFATEFDPELKQGNYTQLNFQEQSKEEKNLVLKKDCGWDSSMMEECTKLLSTADEIIKICE